MNKKDFIEQIQVELEDIVMENYYDEKGSEWCAKLIIMRMEELGIKPPCVDGDKCQFLLSRYIDPSFYYWDEEFEEKFGEEYREWTNRKKKSFKEIRDEFNKNRKGRS